MAEFGTTKTPAKPTSRRRRTAVALVLLVVALIAGLVFVAVQAEGRELSRTTSNDGGAWVVNRELGVVAHKNRATGELSSFVGLADNPTVDVFQAGDVVVALDTSTNLLFEIDPRSSTEDLAPTQLPDFTSVVATDSGVIVFRQDPLTVWRLTKTELGTRSSLEGAPRLLEANGPGVVAATSDGQVAAVESEAGLLHWFDGDVATLSSFDLEVRGVIVDVTIVDASVVVVTDGGEIVVVGSEGVEHRVNWNVVSPGTAAPALLQRPSMTPATTRPATSVAVISEQGELVEIVFGGEDATGTLLGSLNGASPVPPIVHDGCVYGVVTEPPTYGSACEVFTSEALSSAGSQWRLRLVNGWVWINDVDSGSTYSPNEQLVLEELNDWGLVINAANEPESEEEPQGADQPSTDDAVIIDDPDAEGAVREDDEYNPADINLPPLAFDDDAQTRVDATTVVQVLSNDTDPNNDVLAVVEVELLQGEGLVTITPAGTATQVNPAAGFTGVIEYRYAISDGLNPPVSAIVTVTVLPDESNRAPIAETDVVPTTPGEPQTIDVLANDFDPDGDAIFLKSISAEAGTLRWDPSGLVTYTADGTTEAGWVELDYVVADGFGAEGQGRVRIEIREDDANQEPDARNDQLTTVVGQPVSTNLLDNDFDPDGDPLIIGSEPVLVEPADAVVRTKHTADGEFVFAADVAGTYIFTYTVNDSAPDGSESDTARIRVDVLPDQANSPPIAVRDDVVIPVGGTRPIRVLANDGDPDGDVIAIVNWSASPGLLVAELRDETGHVGFEITLTPSAGSTPEMTYSISDGVNPPVTAPVIVAVASRSATDQPPLAKDDVHEGRPGQQAEVRVLQNDFDPEGEPLRIVSVGTTSESTVSISPDSSTLVVFIPDDAESGFSVPYDIEDASGNRASANLRVQLVPAGASNRPPVARTDTQRTRIDTAVVIAVLDNDSDPDADSIALAGIVEQPSNGTARPNADGSILYTPDASFTGTDVFTYAIVDSSTDRALGQVFIGVTEQASQNLPPIANNDAQEVTSAVVTPIRVLDNDLDPDGDPIRVVSVSGAQLGTVTLDNLTVSYAPPDAMAAEGTDTFTYVIADSAGNQDRATVTIRLAAYDKPLDTIEPELLAEPTPTPDPQEPELEPTPTPTAAPEPTPIPERENLDPVATDDNPLPARAGSTLVVDVLANDFDPDGEFDDLSISAVGEGARTDGDVVFVDLGDEAVQIVYTIVDSDGAEASAVINVTVVANQPPVTTLLQAPTDFETAVLVDVAAQVTDPDDDSLFFVCCDAVRGGSTDVTAAAENELLVTFTPDPDFVGEAGFAYTVDDQNGNRVAGSVLIAVGAPGNRAPEALDDAHEALQRALSIIDLARLTSDPDEDDELSYRLIEPPGAESGILATVVGSEIQLDVRAGVPVGEAGFLIYEVSDGVLADQGRIDLVILAGTNQPPEIVQPGALTVTAATSATIDLNELATDSDAGDSLTFTLDPVAIEGVPVEISGSLVTVRAAADSAGTTADVGYTATDTRGGAASGSISVSVVETTAAPPTAVDDIGARTRPDEVVEIPVLANDVDPLLEGLTVVSIDQPTIGSASTQGDSVIFRAALGDTGTATMSYTIADVAGRESTASITIDVVAEPDQPAPPSVTAASEQVTITWETPQLNGAELLGYRITPNVGAAIEVGIQNSYVWPDLGNGTEYSFTVTALSDLGESIESGPSPTVVPDQVPEPPAVRSVTFQDGALLVEWDEPTNLGSDIDNYEIRIGGALSAVDETGATSLLWDDLENGDNYTFELRAHNDAGWSEWGPTSASEHPAARPDPPVISTTVRTQESGALAVSWIKPASDNGDEIIEYLVEASTGGNPVPVTGEDTLTMEWADLTNGVEVSFRVQARNRAGESDWSAWSNEVFPCGRPDPPTIDFIERADEGASVAWTEPEINGCDIIQYWVSAVGSGQEFSSGVASDWDYEGLTNGSVYTFTVQAENEQGRSALSAPSAEVIPAGPPIFCPTSGTIAATATGVGQITVTWDPAIANGDPLGVSGYDVRVDGGAWQPANAQSFDSLGNPSSDHLEVGLQDGQSYSFEVRAINTVDVSPTTCGPASATTWALPAPLSGSGFFLPDPDMMDFTLWGGESPSNPRTTLSATLRRDGIVEPGSELLWQGEDQIADFLLTGGPLMYVPTEEGTYDMALQVCNAVGCVDSVSESVVVTLPQPPDTPGMWEVDMWKSTAWTDSWDQLGVRMWVQMKEPLGAEPTEYEYELEIAYALGAPFEPAESGTVAYAPEPDANGLPTTFSAIGHMGQVLGYSSHPEGVNQNQQYTWRVRVKAINDAGESDWSPWREYTEVPLAPEFTLNILALEDCDIGTVQYQCHTIEVETYGFQPNATYEVSGAGSGAYEMDLETLGGGPGPESGCLPTSDNQIELDENGHTYLDDFSQPFGPPGPLICRSPSGAQIRLATFGINYFTPWYQGEWT